MRTLTRLILRLFVVLFPLLQIVGCGGAEFLGVSGVSENYFQDLNGSVTGPSQEEITSLFQKTDSNQIGLGTTVGDGTEPYYGLGYEGQSCLSSACYCPDGTTDGEFDASMLLLEPSTVAMSNGGGPTLKLDNDIWVKSSNIGAITLTGSAKVYASLSDIFVKGNVANSLGGNGAFTYQSLTTGSTASMGDPLQYAPAPGGTATEDFPVRSNSLMTISSSKTISPGIYHGGISVTGSGTTVIMEPGLYFIDSDGTNGSFNVGSGGKVAGDEVTVYIASTTTGHTVTFQGGGSAQLTPPAHGPLAGYTFWMHRNNASTVTITGGGSLKIWGTVYAASATFVLGGNGAMIAGSQIVAKKLSFSGNSVTEVTATLANGTKVTRPGGCFGN